MGDSANMVIVSVSDEDAANSFFFAPKIRQVWNDIINPGHVFIWELQTQINNDNIIIVFINRAVAANLFQSADGNNPQSIAGRWLRGWLWRVPFAAAGATRRMGSWWTIFSCLY